MTRASCLIGSLSFSLIRVVPAAMFVSLVVVGLVAGFFLATQLGQLRVQNTLGARDFTLVKHGFEVALGKVMPVLVILAGVSIVPLVFLVPPGVRFDSSR